MTLKNIVPFGNFKPGDTLDVPDGCVFDSFYWTPVAAPETKARATQSNKDGE